MSYRILEGDATERLRELPAASVQTCITSPPYWGLRDYGDNGQLGLEPTPEQYVANLVEVFREVRRVLRDDGTLWLNLGDSYCSTAPGTTNAPMPKGSKANASEWANPDTPEGMKPKDLVGIPWMVAFALRADGWYLRSDIIWAKPNPMPESVTDRPTKAHEYIFLLSKSPRYYFDQDAVREGVFQVSGGKAADGVLPATGSTDLCLDLQGVREGASQGMAGAGRRGKREGGGEAVRANGARSQEAIRISEIAAAPGVHEGLSAESSGEGITTADEPVGGGSGATTSPRTDSEGQGSPSTGQGETSSRASNRGDVDGGGMDRDSGASDGAVRLLRDRGTVDDGSCHSAGSGRQAHEGERDGSLQVMQQPQEGSTGRNIRSVWTVTTQPFPGAHFATFPPKLIEPCILAGTSPKCCAECAAPWERVVERGKSTYREMLDEQGVTWREMREAAQEQGKGHDSNRAHIGNTRDASGNIIAYTAATVETLGWQPSCTHDDDTGRATVLDPFAGAGTTGVVALRHDRSFVGIELNPDYAQMARNRIYDDAPLFNVED